MKVSPVSVSGCRIFLDQLTVHHHAGDPGVAICASGHAPTVIQGVAYVKANGGQVVGLTGFDGGQLRQLSDVAVHVQCDKGEYGPVEDLHMIVDHLVHAYLRVHRKR